MERNQLIAAIKEHEVYCASLPGAGFTVVAVRELAVGVIAVRDDDNEYTLYFDQEAVTMRPDSPLPDISTELEGSLPDGVGFIECVTARSFNNIAEIADLCLQAEWYDQAVMIDY